MLEQRADVATPPRDPVPLAVGGAVDRLYDRAGVAPALALHVLAGLLRDLAALVSAVARDGVHDDDSHQLDVRLSQQLTRCRRRHHRVVRCGGGPGQPVDPRSHRPPPGPTAAGPQPDDDLEAAPEDEPEEAAPRAVDRVRRMLGLENPPS